MVTIRVKNHGYIVLFCPEDEQAQAWLKENADGTWFGEALAVEPRFAIDLIQGAQENGIMVIV